MCGTSLWLSGWDRVLPRQRLGFHPWSGSWVPHATTNDAVCHNQDWRLRMPWRPSTAKYMFLFFFFKQYISQDGMEWEIWEKNSDTITLHADRISTSEKLQYCSNIPRSWDDDSNSIQESNFKCWILCLLMASKEGSWAEVKVLNQERTQCDGCNKECLTSWVYTLVRES